MEPGNPFGQGAQHLAEAVYGGEPSGLELIRRVLQRDAQARVLVFSMHDGALLVRRLRTVGIAVLLALLAELTGAMTKMQLAAVQPWT